jgi:hypothetical protein
MKGIDFFFLGYVKFWVHSQDMGQNIFPLLLFGILVSNVLLANIMGSFILGAFSVVSSSLHGSSRFLSNCNRFLRLFIYSVYSFELKNANMVDYA